MCAGTPAGHRLIKQHMGGGFIRPSCECGADNQVETDYWVEGGLSRGGGGTGNEVFVITLFRSTGQMTNLLNMQCSFDASVMVQRVCGSVSPSGRQ